jgi:glycosyltransferase involved in cell wall biosynthesis
VKYSWLKIHGYLDKQNPCDKVKYYDILSNARLFVNTTPRWSGFQALLEAMYFHNPIVVQSNESLRSYFSNLTAVGFILEKEGPSLESILVESLNDTARYQQMSDAAHKAVESSTWNNFTTELIGLLK